MKTPTIALILFVLFLLVACGSDGPPPGVKEDKGAKTEKAAEKEVPQSIKEGKGLGEITNVTLTDPLDESMVAQGKAIVEMKCASCHKLTDQRVVGPGFQGITNKRKPEWIMNMITNTDAMLAEDPAAQALLEECLTRMPNQNVSIGDARSILEFLRKNDMEKAGSKDEAAKA